MLETVADGSENQIEVICRVDEKGLSEEDFSAWKQSQAVDATYQGGAKSPIPEKTKKDDEMVDILKQIQMFPVEQRTPMECMTFVSELKKSITCLREKEF